MVPHLAGRRIYHGFGLLAPTTLPHHPTYSLMMLHVQHDHDHGYHAPPLIEGCGRHVTTHRELLATSSEQRRRAGQRVAGGVQFTAGWSLNISPHSEWQCSGPHLALGSSVFTKTPSPSSLPPWQLPLILTAAPGLKRGISCVYMYVLQYISLFTSSCTRVHSQQLPPSLPPPVRDVGQIPNDFGQAWVHRK